MIERIVRRRRPVLDHMSHIRGPGDAAGDSDVVRVARVRHYVEVVDRAAQDREGEDESRVASTGEFELGSADVGRGVFNYMPHLGDGGVFQCVSRAGRVEC